MGRNKEILLEELDGLVYDTSRRGNKRISAVAAAFMAGLLFFCGAVVLNLLVSVFVNANWPWGWWLHTSCWLGFGFYLGRSSRA